MSGSTAAVPGAANERSDPPPSSSSPNGRLGQWSPTRSGLNPGRTRRARSRSSSHAAIAPIQRSYCLTAAGTSPIQPWLMRKTSVYGSVGERLLDPRDQAAVDAVGVVGALRPGAVHAHEVVLETDRRDRPDGHRLLTLGGIRPAVMIRRS